MKFIIVLVIASFTVNAFAQAVPLAAKMTRSEARAALIAAGTMVSSSGQAYTVDGCLVPNDTGTLCSASAAHQSATLQMTAAPAEPSSSTSPVEFAPAPLAGEPVAGAAPNTPSSGQAQSRN
jgi:hypothetical protein